MVNCPLYILIYIISSVWASLVAQLVKNLPGVQETQVLSLGWEDPLEEEMVTPPVSLPGKSHGQRSLVGCSPWGCKESGTTEQLNWTELNTIWEFLLISFFPFLYSNVFLQTRMWVMRFPVLKKIGDTALWGNQADFERTPELASSPCSKMLDSLYVFSECAFMLLPFHFCPTHDYILCAKHSFPK